MTLLKPWIKKLLCGHISLVVLLSGGNCLAQPPQKSKTTILAKVEGERIALDSRELGFSVDIDVVLPASYDKSDGVEYPVIFLLDSQWKLMPFTYTYGVLAYEKVVPESIVVGINANATSGPWANNVDKFRSALYTPEKHKPKVVNSIGGGANKLLSFFEKELIPYVHKNYRVQHDRSLVGSSLGGLFGLYALLQEEPLFQRYILSSPSIYWGDDYIADHEAHYFKKTKSLDARVFIGVGEEELTSSVSCFSEQLIKRQYNKLDYQFYRSALGHVSNDLEVNARGLTFVFAERREP